jgi:hypothetical protein
MTRPCSPARPAKGGFRISSETQPIEKTTVPPSLIAVLKKSGGREEISPGVGLTLETRSHGVLHGGVGLPTLFISILILQFSIQPTLKPREICQSQPFQASKNPLQEMQHNPRVSASRKKAAIHYHTGSKAYKEILC